MITEDILILEKEIVRRIDEMRMWLVRIEHKLRDLNELISIEFKKREDGVTKQS
jgi:hypothetical protein